MAEGVEGEGGGFSAMGRFYVRWQSFIIIKYNQLRLFLSRKIITFATCFHPSASTKTPAVSSVMEG